MLDALNVTERRDAFRTAIVTGTPGATGLTVTVRPYIARSHSARTSLRTLLAIRALSDSQPSLASQ